MKIVVAPQALKGSLDAPDVGRRIRDGFAAVFPDAEIVVVPVADGGEGTVRAVVNATGGTLHTAQATDPLGNPITAEFGLLGPRFPMRTAIIEMAAASGLTLVPPDRRDPRITTTRGIGDLIRAALDLNCERILIGIGGSATNDGGAGMAQALGVRLLDADGHELPPGGAALARLARIDTSGMDPRIKFGLITVLSDVTNPLCGPNGATAIYGPQKGATPAMVAELDAALSHYADILRRDFSALIAHEENVANADFTEIPGVGAAGGLGIGLLTFTEAIFTTPGADFILYLMDFDETLRGASLVVTAEGQLDGQTAYGKAVGAVAAAARAQNIPVIALTGSLAVDDATLAALGIAAALPIADGPMTLETSMARAADLLTGTATRAARLLKLGGLR